MNKISHQIAQKLLESGAISLRPQEPFTWASGWKSPIYCDNRLTLSFPSIRYYIKKALAQAQQTHFPEAQAIAGVATAGIPQAALVADFLALPMLYVRSKPKGHGLENLIEGKVEKGSKIAVIEDLISTGGSSVSACQALQNAGYEVVGLLAIFTYGFAISDENFANANIPFHALSNYDDMLKTALANGNIAEGELEHLQTWRKAPELWGK